MVVAVIPVPMMQVVLHQVVDVIPVRNLRMPAVGTVDMVFAVLAALVLWGTAGRVRRTDREHVLVHMVAVNVVQVPVVQIVAMVPMLHGHVPAVQPVLVAVSFVRQAVRLSQGRLLFARRAHMEYSASCAAQRAHHVTENTAGKILRWDGGRLRETAAR